MTLGRRLSATDLNLKILKQHSRLTPSQETHPNLSADDADGWFPNYYSGDYAVILCNCTDTVTSDPFQGQLPRNIRIEKEVGVPTIQNAMQWPSTQTILQQAIDQEKSIIIPVTEFQSLFWYGPRRNHYVTLHYNPNTNTATLIDSRSRLLSMHYSTKPMQEMLIAGLQHFTYKGARIQTDEMQFDHIYQGVQHNEDQCGYWASKNIFDLAGIKPNSAEVQRPFPVGQQANRYDATEEKTIIDQIILHANQFDKDASIDEIENSFVFITKAMPPANHGHIETAMDLVIKTESELYITRTRSDKPYLVEEIGVRPKP